MMMRTPSLSCFVQINHSTYLNVDYFWTLMSSIMLPINFQQRSLVKVAVERRSINIIVCMQRAFRPCSRDCSTLAKLWRRPPTTTSSVYQLTYDQRRFASVCPRDDRDYGGNRLNITGDASKHIYSDANATYDEDYDKDCLHMTPNSVTSQDREQLVELEMLRPEDLILQDNRCLQSSVTEVDFNNHNEELLCSSQDDFMELEEDWEILYTQQAGRNAAMNEVLDNVDDY